MIAAKDFYAAFGAAAKWKGPLAGHELNVAFTVNRRAAGIADAPGEFWPVIAWDGPKHGPRDDGTVSYYQYVTGAEAVEIQALRRSVVQKVAARVPPNSLLETIITGLDLPLRPNHPHVALYYFDEGDAAAWGAWFGGHMSAWCGRFAAAPETLESWCRRVLWQKPVS